MKRFISFLLASIMLFSSAMGFAAKGDFIHTGLEKFYNMKDPIDKADFIKDLKDPKVSKQGFYREVDGGKYVNVANEEQFQNDLLEKFLDDNNIDASDFDKFLEDPRNSSKIEDLQDSLNNLPEDLYEDIDNIGDYEGNKTYAPKLINPDNYSTPVPGSKEGMTQFEILKSYANSTKWIYEVGDTTFDKPKSDAVVSGTAYVAGNDIEVEEGDFVILYATDLSNRVKAYDIVKIEEDMIGKAREIADLLEPDTSTIAKGNDVANAVSISGMPEGNWEYFIRSSKLANIFADDKFDDTVKFTNGEDIVVADESTVIDDNFKRYVYLINMDGNKIKEYVVKEIGKNDMSKLPERLVEVTHYVGPVPGVGEEGGTTKFSELKFESTGDTQWMYKIGDDVKVPIAGSKLGDDFTTYTEGKDIKAKVGDKLFLAATDADRKIKAYAMFVLGESNISGEKADGTLHFTPEKGDKPGNTMVNDANLPPGASKFMYAVGKAGTDMSQPFLDRVYEGSRDYTRGRDIEAEVGDVLYILATDDGGRVKQYGMIELKSDHIRNPSPATLYPGIHYSEVEKGDTEGKSIIKTLAITDSIKDVGQWMYKLVQDNIPVMEFDGMIEGATAYTAGENINIANKNDDIDFKNNDKFARKLILLGTVGNPTDYKIKGYAVLDLNNTNVKMPKAGLLEPISNYSKPVPGKLPGTTRIQTLSSSGIEGFKNWGYKILKEEPGDIDYNSTITQVTTYVADRDIRAVAGDYLLLLAMGDGSKIKSYDVIKLEPEDLRLGNAPTLTSVNYSNPAPGKEANTTKFDTLAFSANILGDQWMVATSPTSFGTIALDDIITGAEVYNTPGDDIDVKINDYLLLLATDISGKVKGYREFRLTDSQIRGGETVILEDPRNYTIAKGSKPGSTKFDKLEFFGVADATRWKVKWLDTDSVDIPYMNQVVPNTDFYTKGNDIVLGSTDSGYGWILLLAVDSNSRTKGYKVVPVDKPVVKEHADKFEDLELQPGDLIDSVKFSGLGDPDNGNKYKYLISDKEPATPATGDNLPNGVVDYDKDEKDSYKDITIHIGKHLSLYEVDSSSEIVKFSTFKVEEVNKGTAKLNSDILLEGNIVNGGKNFKVILDNGATWTDLTDNKNKDARDKLFNGFKADSEASEWSKVVASMIADGNGAISIDSDTILTISLPETKDYNITEEQVIRLTIPFEAIEGALNPIVVKETITIKPTIGATISGDVVSSIVREDDIIAGGKTIVIELADGTWATDVSGIINEFESSVAADSNWEKIVTAFADDGTITRNSGSKVTITLPKVSKDELDFDGKSEVISLEIDKDKNLIQGATENVVASPNFTLYPNMIQVVGEAAKTDLTEDIPVILMAPDYRVVDNENNTWTINVTSGTLKENIDKNDLIISGLPRNLVANVSKVGDDHIKIEVTGTASATLATNTEVKVKIKGSAVTEPNSVDSEDIELKLVRGESLIEKLKDVGIDVAGGKFTKATEDTSYSLNDIEYSLDSTNGTNGNDWSYDNASATGIKFKAGRVYIRDASNPKVFRLVTTLSHPKAPTGISVSEVDYKDGMKVKLNLPDDNGNKYEYNTDGDSDWISITPDSEIELTTSSDLRVRLKATVDSLPSLQTNKINVLDLSKVKMNVGEGKLTGTTAQMQYSLNGEEPFTNARANETTSLGFKDPNEIVIRERVNPNNKRTLGTIQTKGIPSLELADLSFDISEKSITSTNLDLQYAIDNDSWKDLGDGKKIEFKSGQLKFRTRGDETHLPSSSVTNDRFIISSPASAPELDVDDFNKDIRHWISENNSTKLEDSIILRYKIDDGDWKDGKNWVTDKETDLIKNGDPKVSVKVKATESALPSLIKVVNFTGNLTFSDVKINVLEGKIEGTTTAMQYGTNLTDGNNITWIDAKAGSTAVNFAEGMKVYIREKSKHENSKELTDEKEIAVGESIKYGDADVNRDIYYDISAKTIKNKLGKILEYRFNNEQAWNILGRESIVSDVEFKAGKLEIRVRATEKTLPSPSIFIDIKAKASAPSLSYNDVTHEVENIGDSNGGKYEYSINGGTWTPGTTPTKFEGGDIVNIRLMADKETLASQEQTIRFTPNLDLNNVILNAGKSQLENTSNLMEYRTSLDEEEGTWISITKTPTELKLQPGMEVYVREKAKPGNSKRVTEEAFGKKDSIQESVLDKIDYNILQSTVSITSTDLNDQKIINDLQYRVNNNNWVNIDYVKLEQNMTKILAYNVNFLEGNLEFRLKGDESTLASDPVLKGTIKSPGSAPDVSVGFVSDDTNYRNEVVGATSNMEYRLGDSGPWIDGTHLKDENLVGPVSIRIKAGNHSLPSLAKKLEFAPVLNLKTINLSTHIDPHELNGTTDKMEYQIYLKDGKAPTGWITCNKGNTQMPDWLADSMKPSGSFDKIEVRDNKQHANTVIVYQKQP